MIILSINIENSWSWQWIIWPDSPTLKKPFLSPGTYSLTPTHLQPHKRITSPYPSASGWAGVLSRRRAVGIAVVTQGEWRGQEQTLLTKKGGKEGIKRDDERWLRLCHCPLLSEETAHGSFTCPMSILQITSFRCFVSRMSTFPGYLVFQLV